MNLPDRLLQLSESLLTLEKTRPRQATLRRAISTAYYSVFHLLTYEYAAMFSNDLELQAAISRTVNHKDIAGVARDFSPQTPMLPEALKSTNLAVPAELITLARAFNKLQDKRHEADYDLPAEYTRPEARAIVDAAKKLFSDWEQARKTPAAKIFLACFQLKKAWNDKR